MKTILKSAILGLCISMPFAYAGSETTLNITTTIPISTIDQIIENTTNQMLSTNGVKNLSILAQNAPWVLGSTFLGLMGLDIIRQSIHTMVDKGLNIEKNDEATYPRLLAKTVLGAGLIGAAGWGIHTILK